MITIRLLMIMEITEMTGFGAWGGTLMLQDFKLSWGFRYSGFRPNELEGLFGPRTPHLSPWPLLGLPRGLGFGV